jgi:hypothetical protein
MCRAINTPLCVVRGLAPAALRFPAEGRVFRGGQFDDRCRGFFAVDASYRAPGFLATSFSEQIAEEFTQV